MLKRSFRLKKTAVFASMLVGSSVVMAQTQAPNIPRLGDFSSQPSANSESPDVEIKTDSDSLMRELSKPLDEISVDILGFDVQVEDGQLKAELESRLARFIGTGRSFEDISNAANTVTLYMQTELGLYLAYAYIPEQTVDAGVVKIAVLQGVLDEVVVNWSDEILVDREVIEGHLSRLRPGTVIKVSEVERVVFLLNDLRGLQAKFEIRAGSKPGTAKLVVTPSKGERLTGRVTLDGNGSRFAGTYRVSALASIESPFGKGDALTVSHLASTTGGVDFTLAGYVMPLGNNGLKVGVNLAQLNYELPQSDFPLGLEGDAFTASAFALYPFVRSRNLNVFGVASYEQKSYEDRVTVASLINDRDVDLTQLTVSGDVRDSRFGGGVTSFDFSLAQGEVNYNTQRPTGLDDSDDFLRFNYGLVRLNNLIQNRLLLLSSLRGQRSYQNLDISEQCRIGGADQVRAFSAGEGTGDTCMVASAELRYVVPKTWTGDLPGDMTVGTFYDYGRVTRRTDPSAQPVGFVNKAVLSGYGIGLNWEKVGDFQFRLSLAWKDDGTEVVDAKPESPRVFFTATKSIN